MALECTDRGSGQPLVLIHAFPLDRGMWEPQNSLADRLRLLTFDLPGFGTSPAESGWTIDSAADSIAKELDSRGLSKVALGGLSMGGYVALAFARRHAERLSALILADTRSEADDDAGRENRNRLIGLTKEFGPSKVYEVMLPKVMCPATQTGKPRVVEAVRAIAARQTAEGVIGGLQALRDRPDATPALAKIAVPTLILVGSEDAITPPALSESMAASIPVGKLIRIPEAGHLSNLENPAAFNEALASFLGV